MKYIWIFCLLPTFLCGALYVDVACTSAFMINAKTGKVLYDKNSTQAMYPASCTKIAFALYAIKYHKHLFEKRIIASNNAVKALSESQKSKNNFDFHSSHILEHDASHMGLKAGEEMRFYDLLEASMIVSADDASNVLAEVMGNGSIDKCVADVNRYLRALGCNDTYFKNAHGLHHPEHVTTARDLALLCQEALKEPLFCEIMKKTKFLRPKTNKQKEVHLGATNRLMLKSSPHYFPWAAGIKTGYHRRAGHCLATQATKNGRSLIAVILQAPSRDDRFKDAKKLFEAAFNEREITKTIVPAGNQAFELNLARAKEPIQTMTQEAVIVQYYPSEEPQFRCQLVWNSEIDLPVKKGTPIGELQLFGDGQLIKKVTLYSTNAVEKRFSISTALLIGTGCLLLLVVAYYLFGRGGRGRSTGYS